MKATLLGVATAVLASLVAAQQPLYEQCGGSGWTGGTTCVAGTYCQHWSEHYWQCMPGTGPSSSSSSSLTSTTTSRQTSSTLTTSTISSTSSSSSSSYSSPAPGTSTGNPAPSPTNSLMRVRFYAESIANRNLVDHDFSDWLIPESTTASTTINGVKLALKPSSGNFDGAYYKFQYTTYVSHLGERVIGQGITTENANSAITLTLTGLSAGTHTLLTYHNSWTTATNLAAVSISVNGQTLASGIAQNSRKNSVWTATTSHISFAVTGTSQTVTVVYTPSGGQGLLYLNGFEIDTPSMTNQISFPDPAHRDERVDLGSASTYLVSWSPARASSPRYNVYAGTSPTTLRSVSLAQSGTTATISGLSPQGTYYWRVDTVVGSTTYIGRVFIFRARQIAFPGAEGWGRWARGGRGGKIVKVTSLADNTNPGTLRYALAVETGPRTVVFDIGGVITLTSRLVVAGNYVTVAGQTAPGKGVIIQGWPVGLSGNSDVIFRHVRVRPGTASGQTIDGMGMAGANYAIFDRCSMGWAIDESFSSRGAHNVTFQRNMISEPLNVAGHQNYPAGTAHGYSATISGDGGSYHHNLIAHAEGRSWSMGAQLDDDNKFRGRLDLRNNVVYNFGSRVTDGSQSRVNFVNNYYKKGPSSTVNYALRAQYELAAVGEERYYCAGNVMPGVFDASSAQFPSGDGTGTKNNIACWADVTISPQPTYQKFFEPYVETQSAVEAYKRVLSDCGASQPVLDDHDKRIVQETYSGSTTYTGSKSGKKGLIDSPADVGGLESFPTTTRPSSWDANNDGIADWWDGSTGGVGYTALEGYLNFMADPHSYVSPSKSVTINLAALSSGFNTPSFTLSGATKGTASVSGSTVTYTAGSAAGIDYFNYITTDSQGSTWTRRYGIAIYAGAN